MKNIETKLNAATKNAAGAKAYAVCRAAEKTGEAARSAKAAKEKKEEEEQRSKTARAAAEAPAEVANVAKEIAKKAQKAAEEAARKAKELQGETTPSESSESEEKEPSPGQKEPAQELQDITEAERLELVEVAVQKTSEEVVRRSLSMGGLPPWREKWEGDNGKPTAKEIEEVVWTLKMLNPMIRSQVDEIRLLAEKREAVTLF